MACPPSLCQWNREVALHFPHLNKPLAAGLALWSLGIIVAQHCGLTAVAWALSALLDEPFNNLRERLRDLYREKEAKAGAKRGLKRQQLDVSVCWAPWLRWIVSGWKHKQLAIALDATNLGSRFTVLAVSVLYRGCAVPVAWKVMAGGQQGAWNPQWKELLKAFQGAVGPDWKVIVMGDRGVYSAELYQAIVDISWHPLLRVGTQGNVRPEGWHHWTPVKQLVSEPGKRWQGRVEAFKKSPVKLRCTLLGFWGKDHKDPWLVVTDLPPQAADVCWYGLRAWIEQGFKRLKRGGLQWQGTRMTDPGRAERLWMALALATWWMVSVGAEADAEANGTHAETIPETMEEAPRTDCIRRPPRLIGVYRLGSNRIVAALMRQEELPIGQGLAENWPRLPNDATQEKTPKEPA